MSLDITKKQPVNKKNMLVIIASALLVIAVIVTSVYGYEHHLDKVATQQAQEAQDASLKAAANKTTAAQDAKIKAQMDAAYFAMMNRLVSICKDSQARYDALPAAQKTKEVRPDCTVVNME